MSQRCQTCWDASPGAYFGGQTYTQVAASLGIPEGTAKTRIRDGLRALGNALNTLTATTVQSSVIDHDWTALPPVS